MNDRVPSKTLLLVDTATGVHSIVGAIEREVGSAEVPTWPWRPIGLVLRHAPLGVVRRFS